MDSVRDRRKAASNSPADIALSVTIATPSRLILIASAVVAASAGAEAHKLKAFATAEGSLVSGYAYFTPGGRAQLADVTIAGPGGVQVLETGVNEHGEFHFVAKQHIDYVITVDGGDSHIANFTIHASDLSDSLPAPVDGKLLPLDPPTATTAAAADTALAPQAADTTPSGAPATLPAAGASGLVVTDPATLRALIRESVAREVNPLREQLDGFQESVGWRDVVSGIGYIFGLCGVAYFFGTWRANRRPSPTPRARAPAPAPVQKSA